MERLRVDDARTAARGFRRCERLLSVQATVDAPLQPPIAAVEGGPTPCAPRQQPGSGPTVSGSPASSYAAICAEAEDAPCSGSVALGDEGLALSGGRALPVGEAWLVRYADVLGVESCAIRRCG